MADVDEEVGELFLMEEEVTNEVLGAAIRRATVALKFVPVMMGSAFKNKGVQPLLNGVKDYLPTPAQVRASRPPRRPLVMRTTPRPPTTKTTTTTSPRSVR